MILTIGCSPVIIIILINHNPLCGQGRTKIFLADKKGTNISDSSSNKKVWNCHPFDSLIMVKNKKKAFNTNSEKVESLLEIRKGENGHYSLAGALLIFSYVLRCASLI